MGANAANIDKLSHPHLFPRGRFGENEQGFQFRRDKYYRARLAHKSRRFARNHAWIFDSMARAEQKQIEQGIFIMQNTGIFKHKTAGQLRQMASAKSNEMQRNVQKILNKVRGSHSWWQAQNRCLKAMDQHFGPASIFMTLSCVETKWQDLYDYLREKNKDLGEGVLKRGVQELLRRDPVSLMQFYIWRVENFFKTVIKPVDGTEGVFGVCEHYYARIEFQARGAPHVHCKL